MSSYKATKSVPIGTNASNAHPAIGRDRSDTIRQLPESFDSASIFLRSRAEEKRAKDEHKDDWEPPSDWSIEIIQYGDEWDEQYPPEVIVAEPSVIDSSGDLSLFDIPSSPYLTRQNAVCYVCCEVEGTHKTNGMCQDCYDHPLCLHCGMKCENKDDSLCKEHSHLTMLDLYYGTCGSCKTEECTQRGYTQLCGYCLNCAAYEHNHLSWTPIMSIDEKDQAQAPEQFFCGTCGSDLYLGYCPDIHCQNTCPNCLKDNDGWGQNSLCNYCHNYDPDYSIIENDDYDEDDYLERFYSNEYEASMINDDRCQLCGFGIDTPCSWCRQDMARGY